MPLLLELFSGTQSISRAFEALGWETFTVDIDPKTNPSLCIDVHNLRASHLPKEPDFVWASCPCQQYSRARTHAKTPRDLEAADNLVRRTLEIIRYYNGVPFMIENPHSGLLKTRDVIQGIPMLVVDYCQYGTAYRKRTALWTNTAWTAARPLCDKKTCPSCENGRHKEVAQQNSRNRRYKVSDLHAIPTELCREIAEYVNGSLLVVLD